jgi:ABC-type branched-subunit amino acid transport system permease subunit
METHFQFLLLGLGAGAIYAVLGLGLVLEYRASGVVNFAHAALAVYVAFVYVGLREDGTLLFPVVGVPHDVRIASGGLATAPALLIALAYAAALGLLIYLVIFRRLANAPPLTKLVASVGVMLALQAMLVLNLGSSAFSISGGTGGSILPSEPVSILGASIPRDRLYLAAITAAIGLMLWAVYRYTTFGLATRAAAESERGIAVVGYSRTLLGSTNWVLASVLAGLAGILVAPISGLDPGQFTLFVIPALAAALLGRLTSFSVTLTAGLVLGMLQSEITKLTVDYEWLPQQGLAQGLPFLAIVVALAIFGRAIPARDALMSERAPRVGRPRRILWSTGGGVAVGAMALFLFPSDLRLGLTLSLLAAVLALSLVVVTGFTGQVSLCQMGFAGFGAFMASILSDALGVGFPWSLFIGAVAAIPIGLAVGIPALRVRGMHLAVLTLAAGVALDSFVFGNADFAGGLSGRKLPGPSILGRDLSARGGDLGDYPRPAFGLLALTAVAVIGGAIAYLRRSGPGRRMLAVRANERAALAVGVTTTGTKLLAFGASALVAGLAGALIGTFYGTISGKQFGVFTSLLLVSIVTIGGIGRISGAILAALLFAPQGLGAVAADRWLGIGDYMVFISAVLLILVTIAMPDGLAQGISDAAAGLRRRFRASVRQRPRRTAVLDWDDSEEAQQQADHVAVTSPTAGSASRTASRP